MNRTQDLIWKHLQTLPLNGEKLLVEALLWRGFLVFQDQEGVWLANGSHEADATVLQLVGDLVVVHIPSRTDRYCKISLTDPDFSIDVARSIIGLPEHHAASHPGGFTGFGLGRWQKYSWKEYRKMKWGAKLPVCPANELGQPYVNDALDIGIALLVKALPLVGIATMLSCDGHGKDSASISFCFDWDLYWGNAVFDELRFKPVNSEWQQVHNGMTISPKNGFGDESTILMLQDIQQCARQILDQKVIAKVRKSKQQTLDTFSFNGRGPTVEQFHSEAVKRLHSTFQG